MGNFIERFVLRNAVRGGLALAPTTNITVDPQSREVYFAGDSNPPSADELETDVCKQHLAAGKDAWDVWFNTVDRDGFEDKHDMGWAAYVTVAKACLVVTNDFTATLTLDGLSLGPPPGCKVTGIRVYLYEVDKRLVDERFMVDKLSTMNKTKTLLTKTNLHPSMLPSPLHPYYIWVRLPEGDQIVHMDFGGTWTRCNDEDSDEEWLPAKRVRVNK